MATINWDAQDPKDDATIDAIASLYSYQTNILDGNGQSIPNPETKAQFAKRQTRKWWRGLRYQQAMVSAVDAAKASVIADLNANDPDTRYPADTVGLVYWASPNYVRFNGVKGVNGTFRTLICSCPPSDDSHIVAFDIFVDTGCPVYATFSGYTGGTIAFDGGEKINTRGAWNRLVEAPIARQATLRVRDTYVFPQVSSVSFMLNQLTIDSNRPFGEVIAPTKELWKSKGLATEYPPNNIDGGPSNPAHFNFLYQRRPKYEFGFMTPSGSSVPGTIPSIAPVVPIVIP